MKKFICLLMIVILITGCAKNKEEMPVENTEPEEVVKKISLIMGGDALTHESIFLECKKDDGYDFSYPLENIKEIIKDYDLAYYNQETVLGGSEYKITGYPEFNTPQEVGDALIDAGFNLVSLASNHILDFYGIYSNALVLNQREYFLNQKDVISSGSYKSNEDKDSLVIGEKNGITYGLLSYTYGTNYGLPNPDENYLVNFINKEEIEKDIKMYRDKVDLLMVAMHWGDEGSLLENDYQREYAKFLADLDVDIVIGSHPHTLEPIEWIDDTLVIYSLGNLYSNQYFNIDNLSSCLVSVDVVKTEKSNESKLELENLKCDLIFTVLEDNHKVYLYRDLSDEQLKDKDVYFEKYANVLKTYIDDLEIK